MGKNDKNIYRIRIEQIHPHILVNDTAMGKFWMEFRPKYHVSVQYLAFKSGKTWSEDDYAYTKIGARRVVKNLIRNHNREAYQPRTVDKYEIEI